jgi:hypothetical protein
MVLERQLLAATSPTGVKGISCFECSPHLVVILFGVNTPANEGKFNSAHFASFSNFKIVLQKSSTLLCGISAYFATQFA